MKNIFKILGIILIIVGSAIIYFSAIPVTDGIGIAVAAVGLALTIVEALKKTEKKTWKEIVSIVCMAVGGFLCGIAALSGDTVTTLITAIVGVVGLVFGLIVSMVKTKTE